MFELERQGRPRHGRLARHRSRDGGGARGAGRARRRELRAGRGGGASGRRRRSRRSGGKAEALGFDVADMKATEDAIADVAKRLGRLDILVANAGIAIDGLAPAREGRGHRPHLRGQREGRARLRARGDQGDDARARRGASSSCRASSARWATPGRRPTRRRRRRCSALTKTLAREYASREHHGQRRRARLHRHRHDDGDREPRRRKGC